MELLQGDRRSSKNTSGFGLACVSFFLGWTDYRGWEPTLIPKTGMILDYGRGLIVIGLFSLLHCCLVWQSASYDTYLCVAFNVT